jgi:hypothetical protein
MAGKLRKKSKGSDGFDLPPPVITEANRAMMEASGEWHCRKDYAAS